MNLQRLTVEDLFGEFTHIIEFKTDEGLTLLHGPNGTGKTTVLRILYNVFNSRFVALRNTPFSVVNLDFATGDRLQITKRPAKPERAGTTELEFIFTSSRNRSRTWTFKKTRSPDFPLGAIDDIIPELTRIGTREWANIRTGEEFSLDDVLDRFGDLLPGWTRQSEVDVPEWLENLLGSIPIYLIGADRLSQRDIHSDPRRNPRIGREEIRSAVETYAVDLADKIKKTLASYADYSQTLDSTFPTRMLSTDSPATIVSSDAEVRERYSEQAARRNRYVKAGLLDSGDDLRLPDRDLDEAERRVLDKYFSDVDSKLDQLDNLADKLELFLSIINGKFRRKSILVDREKGLRAVTAKGNARLALSSLSSGEQQEIILAYGLLFREKPGTLILLDEPELSLHVSWQLDLIPDLLRIADLAQLEFLIATHSPQIINDRWDLTVELSDAE